MSRVQQNSNGRGSLKDIQRLINKNSNLLNSLIANKLTNLKSNQITWLSPLENDNYAEYSDDEFINLLKIKLQTPLNTFWPKGGPQWDALGKTNKDEVFLVEAKANIPEIVSPASGAKSPSSIKLINSSLNTTKSFLNIQNSIDWSGKFYQYTNRIAHLYFLRVLNNIDAFLVNVYFINDKTVNGPKCKAEWLAALEVLKTYLGLGNNKLSKYMIDLFVDIEDLR